MLEVLRYLRDNAYKTYIVTGGGQDFVRIYAEKVYGIPPEQVVGSAGGTKYGYAKDGKPIDKARYERSLCHHFRPCAGLVSSNNEGCPHAPANRNFKQARLRSEWQDCRD
jgi:hypothetical protein